VLHGDAATRDDLVKHAAELFKALALPTVVTVPPPKRPEYLREDADFLEQKVLTYLDRLADLIKRSAPA
jgi:hypothetical protein